MLNHTFFFRHLKQEKDAEKSIKELEKGPKLDLGFKEGQTIRINISVRNNSSIKSCDKAPNTLNTLKMVPMATLLGAQYYTASTRACLSCW